MQDKASFKLARGLYVKHYLTLKKRYEGRDDADNRARNVAEELVKKKYGAETAAAVRENYHGK